MLARDYPQVVATAANGPFAGHLHEVPTFSVAYLYD